MQRKEATWLAERLNELRKEDLFPMLNVGSSTEHFRQYRQPWIESLILAPIRSRGHQVVHLDLKSGSGIDLTGDLMDPTFAAELAAREFRSILCSNVLEHVTDRITFSRQLQKILPAGGYLLVTVPRRYPYHPDPIDNGFRPTVAELAALFPDLRVVAGEDVECGTLFDSLTHGWFELAARLIWLFLPMIRWKGWIANLNRMLWMGRTFHATCVVLQHPPGPP